MCGIAFGTKTFLQNTFTVQNDRGEDGVGIVDGKGNVIYCFLQDDKETFDRVFKGANGNTEERILYYPKGKKAMKFKDKEDFYTHYLEDVLRDDEFMKTDMALLHHRKGSVGTKGVENVHPYVGNKFTLLQNGTDHQFHHWGIIEGYDDERSDSYMLLMFLEKHCDTLEECERVLEKLSSKVSYGVIVLTDKLGRILYFSDGARSCSFEFSEDKTTVNWFRSKRKYLGIEEATEGWILLDFNGKVLMNCLTKINEPKEFKAVTTYHQTSRTSFHDLAGSTLADDGWEDAGTLEEYYRNMERDHTETRRKLLGNSDPLVPPVTTTQYTQACDRLSEMFDEIIWYDDKIDELTTELGKYCKGAVDGTITSLDEVMWEQKYAELKKRVNTQMQTIRVYASNHFILQSSTYVECSKQIKEYVEAYAPIP